MGRWGDQEIGKTAQGLKWIPFFLTPQALGLAPRIHGSTGAHRPSSIYFPLNPWTLDPMNPFYEEVLCILYLT